MTSSIPAFTVRGMEISFCVTLPKVVVMDDGKPIEPYDLRFYFTLSPSQAEAVNALPPQEHAVFMENFLTWVGTYVRTKMKTYFDTAEKKGSPDSSLLDNFVEDMQKGLKEKLGSPLGDFEKILFKNRFEMSVAYMMHGHGHDITNVAPYGSPSPTRTN